MRETAFAATDPSFEPARPYRVDASSGPWVALVGAGPGDPDLLTRRAATLLGAADVVLHDWLSGADVLALARPGATLIDVGKGKGCGAGQRYIERLIVAHHDAGARVVRLKGGDPFLFGRGMEEVRAARAAGFDVEIVPGVSSSLGAPSLAGMAVTERGISAQVTIVSGHRVDTDNDWSTLARLDGTLVVLMAATTGSAVADRAAAAKGRDTTCRRRSSSRRARLARRCGTPTWPRSRRGATRCPGRACWSSAPSRRRRRRSPGWPRSPSAERLT